MKRIANKARYIAVLFLICTLTSGLAQAASVQWMDDQALRVVEEVNAERSKRGLGEVEISEELCLAARQRAQEIVQKFSHTRPDGSKWSSISKKAYAENIARGQKSADKVMAAWMSSSGHRQNILRSSYGSIGVACVKVNKLYYWVQLFGK